MVWELLSEVRAYKLDFHPGLLQGGAGEERRVGVEHDNVLPCHTKGKTTTKKKKIDVEYVECELRLLVIQATL